MRFRFIEGPNGEVDWCRVESETGNDPGAESHFDRILSDIDTIFYGRASYDAWGTDQPKKDASPFERKLWDRVHSKTKYVFSRNPNPASKATFVTHNIAGHVNELKRQSGKNIWLYGGSGLITTFVNLDLIDVYLLAVYPVILGTGKPLFAGIQRRVGLKLRNAKTSASGVILLDYSRIT